MAVLPNWEEIISANFGSLEQYLLYGLFELRRLAISNNQKNVVRLAYTSVQARIAEISETEYQIRAELNLNYSSDIALRNGLSFLDAVLNVSEEQAEKPNYNCLQTTPTNLQEQLSLISQPNTKINSFEKFVFWLGLVWHLSYKDDESIAQRTSFSFAENDKQEGLVSFNFSIPVDQSLIFDINYVCSAIKSNALQPHPYIFPSENTILNFDNLIITELNDSAELGDQQELGD